MNEILLGLSLMCGVGKNLISKAAKDKFSGFVNLLCTNIVTASVALVIFGISIDSHILFSEDFLFSGSFLLFAFLYSGFTMLSGMLYILAVRESQVAVCSLIYSCGFLIPTLFAAYWFREPFGWQQIGSISLLVVSLPLVAGFRKGKRYRDSLLAAVFAMLCSGGVGILQKLFQQAYGGEGLEELLFAAFFFMLVISAVLCICMAKWTRKRPPLLARDGGFLLGAILLGTCTVLANKWNLYLCGVFDGVIFFPVINEGNIVLTAVFSWIFLKETLTGRQLCGIVLGVVSIVCLFAIG